MPLLMIDLPVEEFMALRKLAKESSQPLPKLINRMLSDIAQRTIKDKDLDKNKSKPQLYLPQ